MKKKPCSAGFLGTTISKEYYVTRPRIFRSSSCVLGLVVASLLGLIMGREGIL
jgi:hypothetical protein